MPLIFKKPSAAVAPAKPAPVAAPTPAAKALAPAKVLKPAVGPAKALPKPLAPQSAVMAKVAAKAAAKPSADLGLSSPEETEIANMTLEQLTDLFGDLSDKADAIMLNPVFAHYKLAKEEMQKRLQEFDPASAVTVKASKWLLEAGACSKAPRTVENIWVAYELLGKDTFMKLVKLSVGDAEKYLNPEQLVKVLGPEGKLTTNRKMAVSFLGG